AAALRLGCARPDRRPGGLRGDRRAAFARPQGEARRAAGPRGPGGTGRRLLPVPARSGPPRPRRVRGGGHFRPFVNPGLVGRRRTALSRRYSQGIFAACACKMHGGARRFWGGSGVVKACPDVIRGWGAEKTMLRV